MIAREYRPAPQMIPALMDQIARRYEGFYNACPKETRRWLEESAGFSAVRPVITPRFIPSCSGVLTIHRKQGVTNNSRIAAAV